MANSGFAVPQLQSNLRSWMEGMVASKKMAMVQVLVARRGQVVFRESAGEQNPGIPVRPDSIFRIYSMTKPLVSLALMQLYEEGKFQLHDELSKFMPAFSKSKMAIFDNGTKDEFTTVPCTRGITVCDILTHTSGLSYGFDKAGKALPVDGIYNKSPVLNGKGDAGLFGRSCSVEQFCNELAQMPLLFQPGSHWHYGHNSQVVGRLVEVLSGMPLEQYMEQRIFQPLGMVDTAFVVPSHKRDRFTSCYRWVEEGGTAGLGHLEDITAETNGLYDPEGPLSTFKSGGEGLTSTIDDYLCFCQCVLDGGATRGGGARHQPAHPPVDDDEPPADRSSG
jgi:CubicO group peptidase (beta-lactamase class C family)